MIKIRGKGFYHGLLVLVTFFVNPPIQYCESKKQNDLLADMGTLATDAEAALRLSYEEALDSSKSRKVNLSLQLLTLAFMLIKYEKSLTNLLEHKATLEAPIWDLMENAYDELIFFRAFLIDLLRQQTELEKLDDLLMRAEVAAHKAALISSFSYESFMDGINTRKIFDFLQEIESVKVAVREVCFQFLDASLCNTNLTDVEGLINFLLNHLDRVLDCDAGSISFLKNRIPIIKKQLVYLGSFIEDIVQYHNMRQELHDLMKRIQGVNDRTMYVCFFSIRGYRPAWYYMLHLSDVKQLLKFVEAEVKMIIPKVPDWSNSLHKTN